MTDISEVRPEPVFRDKRRAWTNDEIRILRSMAAQNKSGGEIGEVLDRNRQSVNAKAVALGIEMNGRKGQWTSEQEGRLRALHAEGMSATDIAERMGRSKAAIIGCAWRLGLRFQRQVNTQWTESMEADLRRLWDRSVSVTEIAKALGVTQGSASKKAHALGLPRRNAAQQAQRTPKWADQALPARLDSPGDTSDLPGISFLDCDDAHCRFPLWRSDDPTPASERQCCGREIEHGRIYCDEHLSRCTTTGGGTDA